MPIINLQNAYYKTYITYNSDTQTFTLFPHIDKQGNIRRSGGHFTDYRMPQGLTQEPFGYESRALMSQASLYLCF